MTFLATKKAVESSFPDTKVLTFVADSTDEKAVDAAFQAVGQVDVLVNNAGFMAELVTVSESEPANWWKAFEVNVLGAYVVTRAFLRVAAAEDAVLINLTTAAAHLSFFPTYSSYQASKLAGTKFFEGVAVENPGIRVLNLHPGVVETLMGRKSLDAGAPFPVDEGGSFAFPLPVPNLPSRVFFPSIFPCSHNCNLSCSSCIANVCDSASVTTRGFSGLGSES